MSHLLAYLALFFDFIAIFPLNYTIIFWLIEEKERGALNRRGALIRANTVIRKRNEQNKHTHENKSHSIKDGKTIQMFHIIIADSTIGESIMQPLCNHWKSISKPLKKQNSWLNRQSFIRLTFFSVICLTWNSTATLTTFTMNTISATTITATMITTTLSTIMHHSWNDAN